VQLLSAAASRTVGYLQEKYGKVIPDLERDARVANMAVNGLQDFLATFKDNPGRRLISLYVGCLLGLLIAGAFRLDILKAALGVAEVRHPTMDMVLTGFVVGLGSNPTHEVIRAIQEFKKGQKGQNVATPDLPDN
jgi:hypothetical protein